MVKFVPLSVLLGIAIGVGVCICNGEVVYTVFPDLNNGGCVPGARNVATVMDPQPQPIGYCQNHGFGKNGHNPMEVLGCTDNCLCVKQWSADDADAKCNESMGNNVPMTKMTCFDKCLSDCNGRNCGDTAKLGDVEIQTCLQLTGSGQICATPVSDSEFSCETTGLILDAGGKFIDDFANGVHGHDGDGDGDENDHDEDQGGKDATEVISSEDQGGNDTSEGTSAADQGGKDASMVTLPYDSSNTHVYLITAMIFAQLF